MTATYKLFKDARESLLEVVDCDYFFDVDTISDVISETADSAVPVYTGDLLELCQENYEFLSTTPDLETDGSPIAVIITANVYAAIEADLWEYWNDEMEAGKQHRFTVYFSQGSGFNGKEPELADVLDCVAMDISGYDNARDFEDWAADYGYDLDSVSETRSIRRTYTTIGDQYRRLVNFLGDDAVEFLMNEVERL